MKFNIPQSEIELKFSTSSGPGGQNVNKVNSKVTLNWKIKHSQVLDHYQYQRFVTRYANKILANGEVQISSERHRSQKMNLDDCFEKLYEMIDSILKAPKKRIKTKATRSSVEKRIQSKKNKSEVKKNRKKIY
ncbi:MAG: aminoacyl-tRNA hydrolase [Bacteriovoracaceae bacterium]|nr:aminoacyl-tRNA hydrolase [Bacteriovoracaceae bacterium]